MIEHVFIILNIHNYILVYQGKSGKWCDSPNGFVYDTLATAKRECDKDDGCKFIYDARSRGDQFVLCDYDAKMKNSSEFNSTLYIKSKGIL